MREDEAARLVERLLRERSPARQKLLLDEAIEERFVLGKLVTRSRPMRELAARLRQVAPTDATVMILGESGTGKELLAKILHADSPRKGKPFAALHCAALSSSVLESELFGHEKGAFTGAVATRAGKFEHADGGTLFMDEVGDIPPDVQVKLLRVLEERAVWRVGGNEPIPVDVRIVAATHRDLEAMVARGEFRQDLYFRLKVVTLEAPPLRERMEDLFPLMDQFVVEYAADHQRPIRRVAPEVRRLFARHSWPGNVRELRNCIESMVVLSKDDVLDLDDLPPDRTWKNGTPAEGSFTLEGMRLDEVERELILRTLRMVEGHRAQAAKILGIGERTLYRKIKRYNL